MATQQAVISVSLPAAGDLSSHQFKFVTLDTSGNVALVGTGGLSAHGVLQNTPSAAGQAAEVAIFGIVKVQAGATITALDKIQSDGSGLADVAASADHVIGTAVTSGVSGDLVEVLLVSQHLLA